MINSQVIQIDDTETVISVTSDDNNVYCQHKEIVIEEINDDTNEDDAFIYYRLSKGETDNYNSEVDESSHGSIEEIKEVIQI